MSDCGKGIIKHFGGWVALIEAHGAAFVPYAFFTGFILNLENLESLENRPFLQKVRENLENFYPSQGKVRENKVFSLHIIFINY